MKKILIVIAIIFVSTLTTFGQYSGKKSYIAQAVVGDGWRTGMRCVNNDQAAGHAVGFSFNLFENSSRYLGELPWVRENQIWVKGTAWGAGQFAIFLPADSSSFHIFDKTSPGFIVGWVEISQDNETVEHMTCSQGIQFFSGGKFQTEVSVLPSLPLSIHKFPILISSTEGQNGGVALANINQVPMRVTFTLTRPGSALDGVSVTREVASRGHFAGFVTELFRGITSDRDYVERGVIGVSLSITGRGLNDSPTNPEPLFFPALALNTRETTEKGFTMTTISAPSR